MIGDRTGDGAVSSMIDARHAGRVLRAGPKRGCGVTLTGGRQLRPGRRRAGAPWPPRSRAAEPVFDERDGHGGRSAPKSTVAVDLGRLDRGDRGVRGRSRRVTSSPSTMVAGRRGGLVADPSRRSACSRRAAAGARTCRPRRSWPSRPPGWAATVAPAIGSPSLASVTVPWTMPVGTVVMRYGAVRSEDAAPGTRTGAHRCRRRSRCRWSRRARHPGSGAFGAVEQVDVCRSPRASPRSRSAPWRPNALTLSYSSDERAVGPGADGLVVDRAAVVEVQVLPQRVDRRVRRTRDGMDDREAVELVGAEEVHVAVVGQEDLLVASRRRTGSSNGRRSRPTNSSPYSAVWSVASTQSNAIATAAVAEVVELAERG